MNLYLSRFNVINLAFRHGKDGMATAGVAPGIFRRGADSSNEGAKIWFSGYYKSQKSPKESLFTFRRGASMLRRGLYNNNNNNKHFI